MQLHHLVYFSHATSLATPDLIDLERVSAANNSLTGITGFLIHSDALFFQVLEGRRARISRVVERLMRDRRHRDVTICLSGDIEHRYFKTVPMKLFSPGPNHLAALPTHVRDGMDDPSHMSGGLIWEMCLTLAEHQGLID